MPFSPTRAIPCSQKRGSAERALAVLAIIPAADSMYHIHLEYDNVVLFPSSELLCLIYWVWLTVNSVAWTHKMEALSLKQPQMYVYPFPV